MRNLLCVNSRHLPIDCGTLATEVDRIDKKALAPGGGETCGKQVIDAFGLGGIPIFDFDAVASLEQGSPSSPIARATWAFVRQSESKARRTCVTCQGIEYGKHGTPCGYTPGIDSGQHATEGGGDIGFEFAFTDPHGVSPGDVVQWYVYWSSRARPTVLCRTDRRVLRSFSRVISAHLQGDNMAVQVAHRDEQARRASQAPPASSLVRSDVEARNLRRRRLQTGRPDAVPRPHGRGDGSVR